MNAASEVQQVLQSDALRWRLLGAVRDLRLPDSWIGAGFVRNAVWDHLHQRSPAPLDGDVDVIWFDKNQSDPAEDQELERLLHAAEPRIAWSVKNQARMHVRNGDAPYHSATDAMRYWPDTATAIAARRDDDDHPHIAAPYGLDDLLNLILRPTPRFSSEKRHIFAERVTSKRWMSSWPRLQLADARSVLSR